MDQKIALNIPDPYSRSPVAKSVAVPSGIPAALKGGSLASSGLIQTGYNIFFMAAIFIAIVYMMVSGVSFITSGGEAEKVATAKRRMMYSVVGLLVVLLAFVMVNIVFKILGVNTKIFFVK